MRVQFKIVWQEYKMTCLVQERTRDFVAANDVMLDREWLPRGDAQAKNGLGLQGGTLAGKHNTDFPLRHPRSSHPRTEACFAKANKRTHLLCHRMSSVLLNEENLFWMARISVSGLFKIWSVFVFNQTPSSLLLNILKQVAMPTNQEILMNVPYYRLKQACNSKDKSSLQQREVGRSHCTVPNSFRDLWASK